MSIADAKYSRSIDGMRAVAVTSVIVNHMVGWALPGGYLGVDIFFVISGFVITQSLLSREDSGVGRSLVEFYARRMKRLLPALIVVVIFGICAIKLFDPKPTVSITTGTLALFGVSNIFLYSQATDYFGTSAALNIFTHTWSLGVEEQFYLVYPVTFALTAKMSLTNRIRIFAALSALSASAFVVIARIDQPAAYLLVPFRFWELGAGCIAALVAQCNQDSRSFIDRIPASLSLFSIVLALTLPKSLFVVSTFIIVISTSSFLLVSSKYSFAQRILSAAPIVYIGKISYSLYLWHWLAICLSIWTIGIHWWSILIELALIFAAANLSYRFLEVPLRYGPWMGSGWRAVGAGAALILIGLGIIGADYRYNLIQFSGSSGDAKAIQPLAPGYIGRHTGRSIAECRPTVLFDSAAGKFREGLLDRCRAGKAAPLLVFMGDSHAMDLFAMADLIAAKGSASVLNVAQDGCQAPPLPDAPPYCYFQGPLIDVLKRAKVNAVLVLRNNYNPRAINGSLDRYMRALESIISKASRNGIKVVYVAPAPKYSSVGPTSLCSVQWFRPSWSIGSRCEGALVESRAEQLARRREFLAALRTIERSRSDFLIFDPFDTLCGPAAETCSPKHSGRLFYHDESHLTEEGSEMLEPAFVQRLKAKGWLSPVAH